jgi:hypothetical protein
MSDDEEVRKILRDAIAEMPLTIQSVLSNPKTSPSERLKWVKLAIRVPGFRDDLARRYDLMSPGAGGVLALLFLASAKPRGQS